MTQVSTTWLPSCRTGAEALACIKTLSDALTTVGITKTSATGQIDLTGASVTLPTIPGVGTFASIGYEIRQMASSGKSTLYLKFDYGLVPSVPADATTARLCIRTTAGLTSDGAAGITQTFSKFLTEYSASIGPLAAHSLTAVRALYVASDGANWLNIINDPPRAGSGVYPSYLDVLLERTITASTGSYNGLGFAAMILTNTTDMFQILTAGGASVSHGAIPCQSPGNGFTSSGALSTGTVLPITVCLPAPQGPMLSAVAAYVADVSPGTDYTIPMYGSNRTYKAVGPVFGAAFMGVTNGALTLLARVS